MEETIINKVAKRNIKTIDLDELYPTEKRVVLDISKWLYEEQILKETLFREHLKNHNWEQYKNCFVAITCSVDAIIPSWANLLVVTYLQPYAKNIVIGNLELLETIIFKDIVNNLDISDCKNIPVIIKGCSRKNIPQIAYCFLIEKLQPVAKSIMFGEACSTVPLYKRNTY